MSKDNNLNKKSDYIVTVEDIENGQIEVFEFDDYISELENCKIKAELEFNLLGDFIEVSGNIKGSVTLECDRCLNKYEYKLDFDIDETFAQNSMLEDYGQEVELSSEQFITDLNGANEIDVYDLLYQSVILALPNKKVCGINCNEGLFVSDEDIKTRDTRMDVFKNIPIKGKNN